MNSQSPPSDVLERLRKANHALANAPAVNVANKEGMFKPVDAMLEFQRAATDVIAEQRATIERLSAEHIALNDMREIAQELGYPSILEALEATPRAALSSRPTGRATLRCLAATRFDHG